MSSSRLTGYSPFAPPMSKRDTPDEETNDWRAVCGRTARTVRRAGRGQPFPTPIEGRFPGCIFKRDFFTCSQREGEGLLAGSSWMTRRYSLVLERDRHLKW